uniref:C2 domain-containing protein n=1 Tax=Globodera rostochiensis TaxID=31243 RepID=A0A914H0D0_GLORO
MSFIPPIGPSVTSLPLLFILPPLVALLAGAATDNDDSSPAPSGFWLSTEPAFKLVHTMTLNGQKSAMSWPVDGNGGGGGEILQGQSRQFVSHWTVGDPEDVSIGCQIAGTDPSFGFARVCDETSTRRVFQEAMVRRTVMQQNNNRAKRKDGGTPFPLPFTDNGEHYLRQMVVEMRGRCFNATLAVRGHLRRCPWCPDPNVHIHVVGGGAGAQQGADGGGGEAQQQQLDTADSLLFLHNIVIVALSGAVVFAFTGLCAVFVTQRRHRRKKQSKPGGRREGGGMSSTLMMMRGGAREKGKKRAKKLLSTPRAQQALPTSPQGVEGEGGEQTMIVYGGGSRRIAGGEDEEEERYDTPWDNKYCLVPRQWLLDNNGMAPPADLTRPCVPSPFQPPPPSQLHRPTPYDHPAARSPMMGILSPNNRISHSNQPPAHSGGIMSDQPPLSRIMPNQPPPPPPPIAVLSSTRHSQPKLIQQQHEKTFTSPNTSSGSASRHDDSGLDSV